MKDLPFVVRTLVKTTAGRRGRRTRARPATVQGLEGEMQILLAEGLLNGAGGGGVASAGARSPWPVRASARFGGVMASSDTPAAARSLALPLEKRARALATSAVLS